MGACSPKVWTDRDANNFVSSKNGMMIWAFTAKQAVISHNRCESFEVKCVWRTRALPGQVGEDQALPQPRSRRLFGTCGGDAGSKAARE